MCLLQKNEQSDVTRRVMHQLPPQQFGRYLVVGVCNTIFGYAAYAGLTALLTPRVPFAYVLACLLSGLAGITFAFLAYKWFVFKTQGHYLREWARCILVYGGTVLLGAAVLPLIVFLVRYLTPADKSAAYIAGAIQMGAAAVAGFLGHKNFSFASVEGDAKKY